jgi:outer membrane murein-binding lipoprotein Lpp
MGQQETSALNQMNEMLQGTLDEQTRLLIQVKTLEDQVKALRRDLQTAQNEAANKTKDVDILRSCLRRSEQHKRKNERDVRETETEMEKNIRLKDSMISKYTHQIEELQVKTKRIPQLASQ